MTHAPRKLTASSVLLVALLAAGASSQSACESDRHLIGEGAALSGQSGGNAGSDSAGPASGGTGGSTVDALTMVESGPPEAPPPGAAGDAGPSSSSDVASAPAPRALVISPREAVRRLVVVLWNQPTDATLIAEADAGKIRTPEDVRALAVRMLADPRARAGVGRFYRWWLHEDRLATGTKDPTLFPEFTAALRDDMGREAEQFGVHLTLDIDAKVPALYETNFSFLNDRLAAIYGVTGMTGQDLRKTTLPDNRAGVLTLPVVLTTTSNANRTAPTHRGIFIANQFLCIDVPAPPANIPPLVEEPLPPNLTTRQRLTAVVGKQAACSSCHDVVDPMGFALEGFDPIGRSRSTDNGSPVDTSAMLKGLLGGPTGQVSGAVDLAHVIARSPLAGSCFVQKWLDFALARPVGVGPGPDAFKELPSLVEQARQSDFNLQQVIATVLQSDAFLARESAR